jgi:hypothetical protein
MYTAINQDEAIDLLAHQMQTRRAAIEAASALVNIAANSVPRKAALAVELPVERYIHVGYSCGGGWWVEEA